jgi:glycerol-3-phosphate acyltransferase PlsY
MAAPLALVLVAAAFLAGAVPFGVLVARRRGVEIREHGSGNIGATNVTRVLGARAGAVVLLLDAAKGALPALAALRLGGGAGVAALAGGAAILGHCFSPFLGWRGGKGVATAFGVFLVLEPALAGLAVAVFVVVLRATRVPALGSLAGVLAISAVLVARGGGPAAVLACATCALLVYTHRTNLAKLRQRGQ